LFLENGKGTVFGVVTFAVIQSHNKYRSVDVITMVVKQMKGCSTLKGEQDSALNAVVTALRALCEESASSSSTLSERKNKILGSLYVTTNPASPVAE